MLRDVILSEISDGKFYSSNDMVRTDCHDCDGCESCCHGMGESILLDPYDMWQLSSNLKLSPEQILSGYLELGIDQGLIFPHLKMQGDGIADGPVKMAADQPTEEAEQNAACGFLKDGRCSIHAFRPGICRLFPLGRFYENGSFSYFLQVHECPKPDRTKVKISKWLGIPNLKQYEKYISDWHYFVLDLQAKLMGDGDFLQEEANQINVMFLNLFYLLSYEGDFYEQFYERLELAKHQLL